MTEPISTIASAFGLLKQIAAGGATRAHVDLLEAKLRLIEQELASCQERNRDLEQQVRQMHQERAAARVAEEFTSKQGALFKRGPDGRYEDVVYCPTCRRSTFPFEGDNRFHCMPCHWTSPFVERDVPAIVASLNA